MDITMAAVGNTAVAPSYCISTQFLFEAIVDLTKMYLSKKWTGQSNFAPFQYTI
jgi:hypothetical protein